MNMMEIKVILPQLIKMRDAMSRVEVFGMELNDFLDPKTRSPEELEADRDSCTQLRAAMQDLLTAAMIIETEARRISSRLPGGASS